MKKHITLSVDAEIDDYYAERGYVKSRMYEIVGRIMKAVEDGEVTSRRAYSVRCGQAALGWRDLFDKRSKDFERYLLEDRRISRRECEAQLHALENKLDDVRDLRGMVLNVRRGGHRSL